tara:strand:- start:10267 stop:10938 length:672 start_codon:yes stop_codon:yes gene_type:complete
MGSQDAKPREAQGTIRGLFPTPVVECMMPDAPALNAELKQVILAREKADKGTQHSNLGGWQSDWEFESWGGPAVTTLLDASRTMASQLTCDRMGRPVPLTWLTNCWANVNRDGHGNEFHTHPGAYWSASYYVDDGGIGDDPALGGEFEIQDPRGVAPAMLAPSLAVAMPGGQSIGASETVRPRAGLLLIFPSWLSHGVRPYHGDGVRISVAINLTPAPGKQSA